MLFVCLILASTIDLSVGVPVGVVANVGAEKLIAGPGLGAAVTFAPGPWFVSAGLNTVVPMLTIAPTVGPGGPGGITTGEVSLGVGYRQTVGFGRLDLGVATSLSQTPSGSSDDIGGVIGLGVGPMVDVSIPVFPDWLHVGVRVHAPINVLLSPRVLIIYPGLFVGAMLTWSIGFDSPSDGISRRGATGQQAEATVPAGVPQPEPLERSP